MRNRATFFGFLAVLLWSTTIAVMRSLTEQLGPCEAGGAVFLTAGVLASVFPLLQSRRTARHGRPSAGYLVACGSLFVFYMAALTTAVGQAPDRIHVLEIGLLNYLWPTLTILFSIPILGKRGKPTLLPATLAALAGVALVLSHDAPISFDIILAHVRERPTPYMLATAAATAWALYSTLTRRLAGADRPGAVPFFLLASGAVLLALGRLSPDGGALTARASVEVLFLATATALAYAFWEVAMRHGDLVLVASFSYFTPLFSTLATVVYLETRAGSRLWWGCGLLVVGAILSRLSVTDDARGERGGEAHGT